MAKGIYCYIDKENDKIVYVGKDSNINKNKRHRDHLAPSLYNAQPINRILQNNPDRYKYCALWEIDDCTDNHLNQMEIFYIKKYDPQFNLTEGGERVSGFRHSEETMEDFKFIDLFAGIGGFHQAMEQLGGECVLASEIDKYAIETYGENYHINSQIDICDLKEEDVPEHDVLCAGFPCQAFSKAGKQLGFDDETRGTLFFEIERILKHHHPKYIILENVRNLASHDKGRTWKTIEEHLHKTGYRLTQNPLIISPHYFGTPQLRERVVILGIYDPENVDKPLNINMGHILKKDDNSIYSILEEGKVDEKYYISEYEEKVITMWDEFYKGVDLKVIGFPVWFDWFKEEPPEDVKPWKRDYINKNNQLYQRNKEFVDSWIEKWDNLEWCVPTHRKFEWQAGDKIESLWDGLIQFRPSGVRVKVPTCFPALVAMVQIPIIGKYKRRLTVREAARLQDFPESFVPNENDQQAYKQFGNAVNVEVIKRSAESLFNYKDKKNEGPKS